MAKGTPSVLHAIEQLQKRYNFDFKLIHGVPHAKAVAMVRDCDVMLDQFVVGGFGVASLEAMAMGKPVIASALGGNHELVDHGKTGYLVENGKPEHLITYISHLLSEPHAAKKM